MIIVEGPDNSGKSTLISNLMADLNLTLAKSLESGPPKTAMDLYNRSVYLIEQAIMRKNKNIIADRSSIICESIYGPLCRGKDLWVDLIEKKIDVVSSLNALNPFYIYCRPPIIRMQEFVNHNIKSYDTEEHLSAIEKKSSYIIKAYDNYFATMNPYLYYVYDYTQKDSYNNLIYRLKEYLK